MAFDLEGYVDVAERITAFYEKYPDGRLTRLGEPKIMDVGGKLFVYYTSLAYRTPDDPKPAVGTAWEPFPGPTKFTKDSELMNAETSAWGRAIVAAGVPAKRIASREEVRNRLPEEPRQTISPVEAQQIWNEAQAAGVAADTLQRAASHVYKDDVGPCGSKMQALAALQKLSGEEAVALGAWIASKAAARDASPEGTLPV